MVAELKPSAFSSAANPWYLVFAGLVGLGGTVAVETVRVVLTSDDFRGRFLLGTVSLGMTYGLSDLVWSVAFLPGVAMVIFLGRWIDRASRRSISWLCPAFTVALCGATAFIAFRTLASYDAFANYPPAWVAFSGFFLFLVAALLGDFMLPRGSPRTTTVVRFGLAAIAQGGALGCFALDIKAYKGDYPTLHASLLQVGLILLSVGTYRALVLIQWNPVARTRALLLLCGLTVLIACPFAASGTLGAQARSHWTAHSTLGQSQALLHPYREPEGNGGTPVLDPADARATFALHSHMPILPDDFDLGDYNVLLLLSEATRFDQTSLAGKYKTTRELLTLRDRGAFSFKRAHSPSSGTFQSLGGMFGMSYPSMLHLEVWNKPWTGAFRDKRPTVAELFKRSGYETFWIGHNKATCFTQTVLGFERGFDTRELLSKKESDARNADALIAERVIKRLSKLAEKPAKRFFGFAFFVSPHSNYKVHFPERKGRKSIHKYRQELEYMDAQVGKVLQELETLGRFDDTIVIYAADHGEEFLEHGGRFHKSTIYGEVTHVPLLVFVPGIQGRTLRRPVSTMYVFPWLLQRGSDLARDAVSQRLQHDIGPLMKNTRGAVVTELLGPHRMLSSLIYRREKINYDFNAQLHQAFRTDGDPFEKANVFERDAAAAKRAITSTAAYRGVRADRRAFVLRPDKKDPRPGH